MTLKLRLVWREYLIYGHENYCVKRWLYISTQRLTKFRICFVQYCNVAFQILWDVVYIYWRNEKHYDSNGITYIYNALIEVAPKELNPNL
jgi:hypothetical protein